MNAPQTTGTNGTSKPRRPGGNAFAATLICAIATLTLPVSGLGADEAARNQAEQALLQGLQLFTRGRCDEAMPLWRTALRTHGHGVFLLRLGDCYRVTGHPLVAAAYYRRALAQGDDWLLQKHRQEIQRAIADCRARRPEILVNVPPDATVLVNGRRQDNSRQIGVAVPPGEVTVHAAAPGHDGVTRTFELSAGRTSVELPLRRQEALKLPGDTEYFGRPLRWPLTYVGSGLVAAAVGGVLAGFGVAPGDKTDTFAPGVGLATLGVGLVAAGTVLLFFPSKPNGQ